MSVLIPAQVITIHRHLASIHRPETILHILRLLISTPIQRPDQTIRHRHILHLILATHLPILTLIIRLHIIHQVAVAHMPIHLPQQTMLPLTIRPEAVIHRHPLTRHRQAVIAIHLLQLLIPPHHPMARLLRPTVLRLRMGHHLMLLPLMARQVTQLHPTQRLLMVPLPTLLQLMEHHHTELLQLHLLTEHHLLRPHWASLLLILDKRCRISGALLSVGKSLNFPLPDLV